MSRLIDADALEMVMTQDWFLEILATQDSKSAIKKDIENCIDNIPTAYDPGKVVAELEKESDFFGGEPMGSLQKAYYCKGVERAIDIVKRGGIE